MSPDMSIDHATLESKQPCRLLALPAELRNKIYTMAFEDEVIEDPCLKHWVTPRHLQAPSLLMTCHQIYDEARLLFYTTATFRAAYNGDLRAWFEHIPESNRCHIHRVQFFVPLETWMMTTRSLFMHWDMSTLEAAISLKDCVLRTIRDTVRSLNGRDINVETNIWVNSRIEEETDPDKLRDAGPWVEGEQMQDLVPLWTSDPEAKVREELEKRARLLKRLEERAERNKKDWGEQAFLFEDLPIDMSQT